MEQLFLSSDLFSHEGKLLEEHLIEVAKLAKSILNEKPLSLKDKIKEVSLLCALFHDIGKATTFFQDYLKKQKEVSPEKRQHSLLSAFFGFFVSVHLFNSDFFKSFLVFFLISKHHSNLSDPKHVFTFEQKDFDLLLEQIDSIQPKKFNILLQNLVKNFETDFPTLGNIFSSVVLDNFKKFVLNFQKNKYLLQEVIFKYINNLNSLENYIIVNTIFSILLDADKSDVVLDNKEILESRFELSKDLVTSYINSENFLSTQTQTFLNYLRQDAYSEVLNKKINPEQRVYTLTLPTGLGKTLISLSFALKLRNLLGNSHRIIYSLPFLSIIDQNFDVFTKVLSYNGIPITSNVILKHHHLSDLKYVSSYAEMDFDYDESKILIEGWNSEIIVTTFVQFFQTIVSNSNRNLRKFHRLANSIIILDEVQSIPIKYWHLVRNLMLEIVEKLNSYLIFVTATQPLIFEKSEALELVDSEKYSSQLDRIELFPQIENQITIAELVDNFEFGNDSILFILNTIKSAKDTFDIVKERWENSIFLSTHVVPKERLERINEIKRKLISKEPLVVVSTQLVEAGVDIDFNIVVRDLAPFDSIIQSAGRCNRNGLSKGKVFVFNLVDQNGKSYANYIYDSVLLNITQSILKNRKCITEPEILNISKIYFEETSRMKVQNESMALIDCIKFLIYSSLDKDSYSIEDFKLIDEDYFEQSVFVEIDDEAKELWQKFIKLYSEKSLDRFQRMKEFAEFKTKFYEYVISIPKNVKNKPVNFFGNLAYIPNNQLNLFYDKSTGFIIIPNISTMSV